MFEIRDVLVFGVVAGVLGAGGLFAWPWGRLRGRFLVGGVATFLGFIAWNLTLNHTNATGFNVDAPVIQVSWADSGSGVMASPRLLLCSPRTNTKRARGVSSAWRLSVESSR